MIAMGYTFSYIVLQYYAIKQKTTVKSLYSLAKEYDGLSEGFATPIVLGYFITIVLAVATFLELMNHTLSYADLIFGCIAYPIALFAVQLYWASNDIKDSIDITGKHLQEQQIKI